MSSMLSPRSRPNIQHELGKRLRQIRLEKFGEAGGDLLAVYLGIPALTWSNFESGVSIPGDILLAFLVLTDTEPLWLSRGEGEKFRIPLSKSNVETNH